MYYLFILVNSLAGRLDDLLLQQVRSTTSYAPDEMIIQTNWSNMGTNWEVNNHQACTLPQRNGSPPLSHMNSPIDYPPVSDSLPAYSMSFNNTSTSLQTPFDFKANTVKSPHCMALSPQQCVRRQPLSITPQQSLAIEQFKFSSLSNTPAPSSSDEESNASPLPVEAELKNVKTKEEVLKLIPKDVRVPQSKLLK